jgi:hypothetical protein
MSAFVIDEQTMHDAIRVLFGSGEAVAILDAANVRGMAMETWLGRRLFAMNIEAVWQRYPDCRDQPMNTPGPGIDFADWPSTYVYTGAATSEPLTPDDWARGEEAVSSLAYQSGEGNVPDTWPEYWALMGARDRIRVVGKKIICDAHQAKIKAREPAEWVDVKVSAQMLRVALKKKWPATKFSVRIDRYSMGCSTNISWTDGPATRDVDALAAPFSGDRFDSSDDSTYVVQSWIHPDGTVTSGDADEPTPAGVRRVRFSGSRAHTSRELSPDWLAKCRKIWDRLDGTAQCALLNHPKFPRYFRDENTPEAYARSLAHFLGDTATDDATIAEGV